jgi:hypothetical protein
MKKIIIFLIVIVTVSILSCTYNIKVDPKPKIPKFKKYSFDVGVHIDESQLSYVYSQNGFCFVGAVHTWKIPVGEAIKKSSIKLFVKMFNQVHIIKTPQEKPNSINIVISPMVREFKISQTINTKFILDVKIYNKKNKIIFEKEYQGKTKKIGPFCTAAMCGVFLAPRAFSSSVNDAFENAFEKLYLDLSKNVDFNKLK